MGIRLDRVDHAAVVTLDWPDVRNALGPKEAAELGAAIDAASSTDSAAVVITGNGAFCAGGDLKQVVDMATTLSAEDIARRIYGDIHSVLRALRRSPTPTIAAVDGAAIGLGFDIALACDLRIAGARGWFSQGWARAGLIPAAGGAAFLSRLAPSDHWRLMAEQTRVDAAAAASMGIAEQVEDRALDAAIRRANDFAKLPRETLAAYVELTRPNQWPTDEYFDRCRELQSRFILSDEFSRRAAELLGSVH
jgi:enoyl-CoA hydratase